jgi:mRNA-degrading endonuclease toxin of MazEF toxin-antitoxin module
LSVDAVHATGIVVVVTPDAARPEGAVGAVVSGHTAAEAVIDARVELFPAASNACTPNVWLVPHVRPAKVNDVEVVVPALTPSRKTV